MKLFGGFRREALPRSFHSRAPLAFARMSLVRTRRVILVPIKLVFASQRICCFAPRSQTIWRLVGYVLSVFCGRAKGSSDLM
jgi:hypothetical protein